MADEFKPINTQEEFNAAIADRLRRERETAIKPYADYDQIKKDLGTAQGQLAERDKTIATLSSKVKGYETDSAKTRAALAAGLPYEMAPRLAGETEEDFKKDAEALVKLIGQNKQDPPPLRDPEGPAPDPKTAALKGLLNKIKEE